MHQYNDDDLDLPESQACFEQGHWYIRTDDSALFIVPDDRHGLAEISGPDDATLDQLNAAYRGADQTMEDWFDKIDRDVIADDLGLSQVPDWQQRFDSELGYYVA